MKTNAQRVAEMLPDKSGSERLLLAKEWFKRMAERHPDLSSIVRANKDGNDVVMQWWLLEDDVICDAFAFPIGTIVSPKLGGENWTYGTVCGAGTEWGHAVVIVELPGGGTAHVKPEDLKLADIPQEIMQLACNKLKAGCPVLNGGLK